MATERPQASPTAVPTPHTARPRSEWLAANCWLPLMAVHRLLGLDYALVFRRAIKGAYGPIQRDASGQVYVSLKGVERAARWNWTQGQVDAALRGDPLPPLSSRQLPWGDGADFKRKRSVEEKAVRLLCEAPRFTPPTRAAEHRSDELPDHPDTLPDDDLED